MRDEGRHTYGIDYFNRGHWLTRYQINASLGVRRGIFDWMNARLPLKRLRVLELGATPDTERADSNCFARWFMERGDDVALTSLENLDSLRPEFAKAQFYHWDEVKGLPRVFDLVVSSAVLEHTGNDAVTHVRLALQLGHNVLLTTPNRWHWLEFHTKLPLLHWLPRRLHRTCLRGLGMTFWANEQNLHLYSRAEVQSIINKAVEADKFGIERMEWFFPRLLGWVSNTVVLCQGIH